MKTLKNQCGFSLIEVLVALAIIGLTATVFALALQTATKATMQSDVRTTAKSPTPIPTPTPKPKYYSGKVWLDSHTYLVGGNGEPIVLVSNADAKNPTLTQLLDFIRSDQTDKIPYTSTFVCADFAETLYNNAESQGIKAAYIVLHGVAHALNAFQTTDAGLIFIDCTGKSESSLKTYVTIIVPSTGTKTKTFSETSSWDKVAYIQEGQPLGYISLDAAANNYGLSYSGYEKWKNDRKLFQTELDSYNGQVGGRLVVPEEEYNQLQIELQQINLLGEQLGGFWDMNGVVQSYLTFWAGK